MSVRSISAVTFAVADMSRSVRFCRNLGLELLYAGEEASFTSFQAGECFVNLIRAEATKGIGGGGRSSAWTTSTRSMGCWSMRA